LSAEQKPTGAFGLSLTAGIFILFFGLILSSLAALEVSVAEAILLDALICGIVVLTAATLLYTVPKYHVIWGTLVIVFSVFSILSLGGIIIGLVLGIIGGLMGITWKPTVPITPTQTIKRICPQCGRVLFEDTKFCPHCGRAFGS